MERDVVNDFLKRVYIWMIVALVVSGVTALYVVSNEYLLNAIFNGLFFPLILAELGLVIAISWAINKISETAAAVLFLFYSFFTGLTLAVIFVAYTASSIAVVFFITTSVFLTISIIGYSTGKDLSGMGPILFAGLIGIIIAMIVNIFLRSPMMMFIISILGVLIFTGLIAYDTQRLKKMALVAGNNAGKYGIRCALSLYLDFINLFLSLLRLLGQRK